ncbi:MAG: hypothetical protein OEY22_06035 [Candidatus Bathyarchaeota archaeon]|nr:hypothetical protein [Candidatus Bathyarchaeota archaeon]MDH5788905.1 hypothetical protein [Candidatus Bathyarchaeota archaeon]
MGKSKKTPLARGLIGSKAQSVHGQLEVTYVNYNTVHIAIWRKIYSGLSDVNFSVADTDLPDILEILTEAQKKMEGYWLSRISAKTFKTKS